MRGGGVSLLERTRSLPGMAAVLRQLGAGDNGDSFDTLKVEKVKGESLKSLQETKEAIANCIAMQYNTKRLRSALDNISPCAFEEKPRTDEFSRPIVKAKVY